MVGVSNLCAPSRGIPGRAGFCFYMPFLYTNDLFIDCMIKKALFVYYCKQQSYNKTHTNNHVTNNNINNKNKYNNNQLIIITNVKNKSDTIV